MMIVRKLIHHMTLINEYFVISFFKILDSIKPYSLTMFYPLPYELQQREQELIAVFVEFSMMWLML